jgi:hypothetical protein
MRAHADVRKGPIGEDVLMPGFSGLVVDAPTGQRWELALALIDSGEAAVKVGEVVISRNVAGPTADGVLCIAVTVNESADEQVGQSALVHGREQLAEIRSADPRFAQLLDRYEQRWEVVADDGMGTVLLGAASRDGDLDWRR